MLQLRAFGNPATRIHFRTSPFFRLPLRLSNADFGWGKTLYGRLPLPVLNLTEVSGLRTTAYAGCQGVVPPPSLEVHKAGVLRSFPPKPEARSLCLQKCIATSSGPPSAAASAEGLVSRPLSGDSSLPDRPHSDTVGHPSLRLVEIDMEDLEKERRKLIKRNNFYGKVLLSFLVTGGVLMYIGYAASDIGSGLMRHLDGLLELLYDVLPDNFPDPETAHHFVMWLAAKGYLPYDLERMGFGFVEVGTVTPKPQPGNPKPRIFRLARDRAIINRCGFNSSGLDVVEPRLKKASEDRWHDRLARRCVIGVNIGKNKDTERAEEDIREGIKRIGRFADYLVINLSSPNTKGLRALQQRDHLRSIITTAQGELDKLEQQQKVHQAQTSQPKAAEQESTQTPQDIEQKAHDFFPTQTGKRPLLFVKIAPDLTEQEKRDIADVALETGLDGLVVTNTTIQRPESLQSESKKETGGLSGRPLKAMATQCVSDMYRMTNGQVAIISSGGIETGLDAYERIRAGASAVEVYSSMIYRGPVVARRIKDELLNILNQAGIYNVQDAVGLDHRPPKKRRVQKPTFE